LTLLVFAAGLAIAPSAYSRPGSTAAVSSPQTIVSLTFDDGSASESVVRSLLAAHGMNATFYVNSSRLGTDGYLTWAQVAQLAADGNEIGGHTSFHIDLTQTDTTEAQRQVCDDRDNLLDAGFQVTDFAYPYGGFDASAQALVQNCGYNSARTSNLLTPPPTESLPPQDPYAIREAGSATTSVSLATLESYVTQVEQNGGGWAPLVFHQICNACDTYSITQANLTAFLDWLQPRAANGTIVKTVQQVIGGPVRPAVTGPPPPPAPNGSNAVRNASLELDTNTDQAPDCWTFDGYGNQSFAWSRTSDSHSGTKAERVDVTNYHTGDDKLTPIDDLGNCTPTVLPGHRYRITAWYKSNAAVNFTTFTRSADTGTTAYWESSPNFPASSTWRQANWVTDVIPSGINGLSFGLTISSNGFLTVDDLGFDDAAPTGGGDTTAPTVTLTSPAAGAFVAGTVPLTASASDNFGVDHVDFLVDGSVVGAGTRAPYRFNWNSLNAAGVHTISARAVDVAGNTQTTTPISVTVANTGANLLSNASLETATNGTPNCWLLGGYGTNTFTWTRTSDAHSGSWAENLNISSFTSGDRKLVNTQDAGACAPAATPGHTYTVSAWYKSAVSPRIFAYYRLNGAWTYWATSPAFPASASTWAQAAWVSPAVPAGATNLSVGMGLVASGSATMDDFSLIDNAPAAETTPPTSSISCGSDSEDGDCLAAWYPAGVPIAISASDNQGGSGLKEVRYTTDGSDPTATTGTVYGGPFSLAATKTLKWRAIDNAGNLEPVHSQVIQIDASPPATAISCNGGACSNSFYAASVSVTLQATDSGSGVDVVRYTTDGSDPTPSSGNVYLGAFSVASTTTIKYAAFDNVGNQEPVNSKLIQVDTTTPTTSITCNGAPCSSSYYTGPVSIALAAGDGLNGSGVKEVRYTTDGTDPTPTTGTVYTAPFSAVSTTTVKYRAFDNAGNAEPVNASLILIDGTAPASSISCNGASCSSGYYNASVFVTLTATDVGSGVASIRYTTDGSDPTTSNGILYLGQFPVPYTTTVKYRAFDNASNAEAVNTQLIRVDTTAPAATLTSPADGATLSGTVTLTASASDNNGIARVDFVVDGLTVGTDAAAPYSVDWDTQSVSDGQHSIVARAVDVAGNTTDSSAASVLVSNAADTTPPTTTISCNGGVCGTGYVNAAVSVTLAATDNSGGSGVKEIRYTTDGSNPTATTGTVYTGAFSVSSTATVKYRAFDNAGNAEAVHSQLIQIDTVPPTVTLQSPSDGAVVAGTVTLQATASDNIGVDHVDFRVDGQTVGSDATAPYRFDWNSQSVADGTHTVVARAVDSAASTADSAAASITVANVASLDTTPPTSTISCNGGACSNSYYGAAVAVGLAATDDTGGSGVREIRYTTDGTDPTSTTGTVYSGAFTVNATTTVKYRAFDNAGNAESVNSQLIQVDTVPPATAITCNGTACSSSYYNAGVSVALSATDSGSGVAQIRYTTDGTNPTATTGTLYVGTFISVGTTTTVKYRAFDNVGNAEPVQTQLIRIDTTAPSATLTSPGNGATLSGTIALIASASDNVAVDHVDFLVDGQVVGTDATSPFSINWNSAGVADGSHTIAARAVDSAGNATTSTAATVTVTNTPDTTAPTSTISCNGGACGSGYVNAAVSVTLAATDNSGGSGVKEIRYTTDGSNPTATTGTVYTGAFSVSSTTTVKYRAFDNAGNAEAIHSQLIQIDTVPPTSSISCNSAPCSSSFYKSSVSVTLAASDTGGSGVSQIRYTTDGTDPTALTGTVYSSAFTIASTTTVKFRAFDNAGNAEAVNSPQIKVDTIPPSTTIRCNGAPCGTGYFNAAVTVSLTATDDAGGSGVNQIRYTTNGSDPTATTGTVYTNAFVVSSATTVKYRAFDNAGNAEAVNAQPIQFDTTPPTVSLTSPAAGAGVSGTVTLAATAGDNIAVDHVDFRVDGQTVGTDSTSPYSFDWNSQSVADGPHTVVARAVDGVGNATSTSGTTITVTNGSNLLQNPSLETATNGTPNCWLLGGYGTNTFTWTRTSDAHSGSWAENLNISSFTSGDRKLVNTQDAGACAPAATPGHTYTVSAWYKSAVSPRIFAYYRLNGAWTYWATSPAFPASASTWAQAAWVSPAVPAGATNLSVGMGLVASGSATMDDFGLFDNH
jgi:peptidoglycan/xylan/chitin deacetylase (PgdA/CDA1 family)